MWRPATVTKEIRTAFIGIGAALTTATMAFLTSWITTWRTEKYARSREKRQQREEIRRENRHKQEAIEREDRQKQDEIEREERQLDREVAVQQEVRYLALLIPLRAYEALMSHFDKALGGPGRIRRRLTKICRPSTGMRSRSSDPRWTPRSRPPRPGPPGPWTPYSTQMLRILREHPAAHPPPFGQIRAGVQTRRHPWHWWAWSWA
jgi:hypothetical protein